MKDEEEKNGQDQNALNIELHKYVARIPTPLMAVLKNIAWATHCSVNTLIMDLIISRVLQLYRSHLGQIRSSERRRREFDAFFREKAHGITGKEVIAEDLDNSPLSKPFPSFPDIDESILSEYESLSKKMENDFLTGTLFSKIEEQKMKDLVDLFSEYLVWRDKKAREPRN